MKRSKFTEGQILFALKQADSGQPVGDVCRQMGISEATFYVWKKRYGDLGLLEVRELGQLRADPRGLEDRAEQGSPAVQAGGAPGAYESAPQERISLHRGPAPRAAAAGQYWAMDFVHDQLADGRKFRVLTIIDKWHRQCVALHVDCSLSGQSVVDALNEVALERALPYAQPGKPTENGMIESFNGRLRDECLNVNEFVTLDDVRKILKAWRHDYNHCRPHGSLGNLGLPPISRTPPLGFRRQ